MRRSKQRTALEIARLANKLKCLLFATNCLVITTTGASATSSAEIDQTVKGAANSLELILQDAAQRGFLDVKEKIEKPTIAIPPSPPTQSKKMSDGEPEIKLAVPKMSCHHASRRDITSFKYVTHFNDINAVKSRQAAAGNAQQGMSKKNIAELAQTFVALGLGTEALQLAEKIEDSLLISMARIISNQAKVEDAQLLAQLFNCDPSFEVWAALSGTLGNPKDNEPLALSKNILESLTHFPPELQKIITTEFGIYAVETGDFTTATKLLTKLEPEIEGGTLPRLLDDATLYLYASILQNKGDARFRPILKHLSSFDGLYRAKALTALTKDYKDTGLVMPVSLESDIDAVNQQYGQSFEARKAQLEMIKYRLDQSRYVSAIDMAKSQYTTPEDMAEPLQLIGDKIYVDLKSVQQNQALYALNGYFHDPVFFTNYAELPSLLQQAYESALNLNLPNLAQQLTPSLQAINPKSKIQTQEFGKLIELTEAMILIKENKYPEAYKSLSNLGTDDVISKYRRETALSSLDSNLMRQFLSELPETEEKNQVHLEYALQAGLWKDAKLILTKNNITHVSSANPYSEITSTEATSDLPYNFTVEMVDYLAESKTPYLHDDIPDLPSTVENMLAGQKLSMANTQGFFQNAKATR